MSLSNRSTEELVNELIRRIDNGIIRKIKMSSDDLIELLTTVNYNITRHVSDLASFAKKIIRSYDEEIDKCRITSYFVSLDVPLEKFIPEETVDSFEFIEKLINSRTNSVLMQFEIPLIEYLEYVIKRNDCDTFDKLVAKYCIPMINISENVEYLTYTAAIYGSYEVHTHIPLISDGYLVDLDGLIDNINVASKYGIPNYMGIKRILDHHSEGQKRGVVNAKLSDLPIDFLKKYYYDRLEDIYLARRSMRIDDKYKLSREYRVDILYKKELKKCFNYKDIMIICQE